MMKPTKSSVDADQRPSRRFVRNIDLLLLLLGPAVSAYGLAYSPPFAGWLLYLGMIGFAAGLIMNHRKHKRARA
jgi:hypothetical protein